jgi:rhomboid protease GluP
VTDFRPEDPLAPIVISDDMLARPVRRPSGRVDFERGMSYAPRITLLLIVSCMAVFIWEMAVGALESRDAIVAAGALSREEVLQGEFWRLFSPMFLHGSPSHLVGNCIALYVLGMALEHAVRSGRMLLLYVVSGLTGSLASIATGPGPSVGASGAIFGVMAAVIVILYQHQDRFYLRDKRIGLVLAVWAGFTIVTGLLSPYVDNAAHLGGALGGMLVGGRFRPAALRA